MCNWRWVDDPPTSRGAPHFRSPVGVPASPACDRPPVVIGLGCVLKILLRLKIGEREEGTLRESGEAEGEG